MAFFTESGYSRTCHVPGKEVHQGVPDALSRLRENHMPARQEPREAASRPIILAALQTKQVIPEEQYRRIAAVHNSNLGHWGLAMTKKG